jgi:hypothetical protein
VLHFTTQPLQITPSSTKGTSVGSHVAVNIDFVDISDFWALDFSELYGYNTPLTALLDNN